MKWLPLNLQKLSPWAMALKMCSRRKPMFPHLPENFKAEALQLMKDTQWSFLVALWDLCFSPIKTLSDLKIIGYIRKFARIRKSWKCGGFFPSYSHWVSGKINMICLVHIWMSWGWDSMELKTLICLYAIMLSRTPLIGCPSPLSWNILSTPWLFKVKCSLAQWAIWPSGSLVNGSRCRKCQSL